MRFIEFEPNRKAKNKKKLVKSQYFVWRVAWTNRPNHIGEIIRFVAHTKFAFIHEKKNRMRSRRSTDSIHLNAKKPIERRHKLIDMSRMRCEQIYLIWTLLFVRMEYATTTVQAHSINDGKWDSFFSTLITRLSMWKRRKKDWCRKRFFIRFTKI